MSDPVEFGVKSGLGKIIGEMSALRDNANAAAKSFQVYGNQIGRDLDALIKKSKEAAEGMADGVDGVGDGIKANTRRTENFLKNLTLVGRRVADQIRGDFKSLVSLNALQDSLKLSNQFRGAIKETVELSDQIRKLGGIFGIARDKYASFQSFLTKGLGEIGMSSETAVRALEGLATTPVRGQENILKYTTTAGMLASITGNGGKEGEIAGSMAQVIQARGGNVNDKKEVDALADSIRRVFNQTGASPLDTLRMMKELFTKMPQDLRKSFTAGGLANLAIAGAMGGPNAVKFLEKYLNQSPTERLAFESQGGRGIITNNGIDFEKFSVFAKEIMGRVPGDPRLGAKTIHLDDDEAEGFVRLSEKMKDLREIQDQNKKSIEEITTAYRNSMGMAESFRASINRVKGIIAAPLAGATQSGTGALAKASQSDAGAAMVVAGSGIIATLLAGVGLRGFKTLLGTAARKEGAEEVLAQKTIPVYVVNADEIGGGGLGAGLAGGAAGAAEGGTFGALLRSLGLPVAIGTAAVAGGIALKGKFDDTIQGANGEGVDDAAQLQTLKKAYMSGKIPEGRRDQVRALLERYGLLKAETGGASPAPAPARGGNEHAMVIPSRPQKVIVEFGTPLLRESEKSRRGAIS